MIKFSKIRYKNILSVGNAIQEYDFLEADKQLLTGKNGSGKCLDRSTKISICIYNEETIKKFKKHINTTIFDIVDFYNKYPEEIGNISIDTRFGFKVIEYADVTAKDSKVIEIILNDKSSLKCSPDHLLIVDNEWIKVKDISSNQEILSRDGYQGILLIREMDYVDDLYDLQVEGVHEFYANDFVSHNSSITDCLNFVLYNKPFRKIKKEQLINSINKKNLLVEIEFSIGVVDYKIVRGLKPNIFEIYINNKLKEHDAAIKDYQSYLESNILKMTEKTFRQIVILGSTSYVPFMELSSKDRRIVIEDLLNIQVFSVMNDLIKVKAKGLMTDYKESNNTINLLNISIDNINKQNELIESHKKDLEERIDNDIKNIKEDISSKQNNVIKIQEDILDINHNEISSLKSDYKKIYEEAVKIKFEIKDNNNKIEFFKDNSNCPTCEQSIDLTFKENKTNSLECDNEDNTLMLNSSKEHIKDIESQLTVFNDTKSQNEHNKRNIQNLKSNITDLKDKLIRLKFEKEKDVDEQSIIDNKSQMKKLKKELKLEELSLEETHEESSYLSVILELLKDKGIKSTIINSYVPMINKLMRKYLDILEFNVDFQFDENFNETIKSRFRDHFSYANFSEGEKLRINLAILFTWREIANSRNSSSTNLLVLDEIGDSSLDEAGFESFLSILDQSKDQTTLVISHNSDLTEHFDIVYNYKKVDDFSMRIKST